MWTKQQRENFGIEYILTCKSFGYEIQTDVVRLVISDISDLQFEQVMKSLSEFRRNSKNKFWPRANELRALIEGQKNERLKAATLANQLDELAQKKGVSWNDGYFFDHEKKYYYGKNQSYWTFDEALESFIGGVGVGVVNAYGGWKTLAISSQETNKGQFIAQLREFIESYLISDKSVQLNSAQIEFKSEQMNNLISQAIKEIK